MRNSIFALLTLSWASCSHQLVDVRLPKSENPITYSDYTAVNFVQANNVYASFSNRGNPEAWKTLRPVFTRLLSKKLLLAADDYFKLPRTGVLSEDDWWFQRGILYLDGNAPWRCRAQRVGFDGRKARYQVIQEVHTSKGSFGQNDPIYFTVAVEDGSYRVDDIQFMFDPSKKGKIIPNVSIFTFFQYASEKSKVK